jgi:hypothetical protein
LHRRLDQGEGRAPGKARLRHRAARVGQVASSWRRSCAPGSVAAACLAITTMSVWPSMCWW